MKKNSFTLIELLAVIIVLAIILVIAVPRVLNVIEEADKEGFRITGEQLVKASKDRLEMNSMYPQDEKTYKITMGAFVGDSIPMSGELPDNGTIHITSNGLVSIAVSDDTWCAKKYEEEDKVVVSKDPDCVLNIPEPVPESCFTYTSTATEVTITGYDYTCSKNVIIPDTIGGLPVTIIGTSAFSNKGIDSIKISNNVKIIKEQAFAYNKLTNLTVPDSVTVIEGAVFFRNMLKNIKISNNMTIIESMVFAYNQITDLNIPDNIESIYKASFGRNPIQKINIGSGLSSINEYGSYNPDIMNAFAGTDNLQITISPSNNNFVTLNGGIYTKDLKKIVFGTPSVISTIPSSVETIGKLAFANMIIPEIIVPNNVKNIESYAYIYSDSTSVSLPNGLDSIGASSFESNQLTSVTIPSSVTSIQEYAFEYNQLTNIIIPANVSLVNNTISQTFYDSYVTANARAAGTYTAPSQSGTWTKQP